MTWFILFYDVTFSWHSAGCCFILEGREANHDVNVSCLFREHCMRCSLAAWKKPSSFASSHFQRMVYVHYTFQFFSNEKLSVESWKTGICLIFKIFLEKILRSFTTLMKGLKHWFYLTSEAAVSHHVGNTRKNKKKNIKNRGESGRKSHIHTLLLSMYVVGLLCIIVAQQHRPDLIIFM